MTDVLDDGDLLHAFGSVADRVRFIEVFRHESENYGYQISVSSWESLRHSP